MSGDRSSALRKRALRRLAATSSPPPTARCMSVSIRKSGDGVLASTGACAATRGRAVRDFRLWGCLLCFVTVAAGVVAEAGC